MKIARGRSVELAYELKVKGGAVIESSTRTGRCATSTATARCCPGWRNGWRASRRATSGRGRSRPPRRSAPRTRSRSRKWRAASFPPGSNRARRRLRGQGSCFRGADPLQDPLRRRARWPTSACFTRWSDVTSSTGSPSSPSATRRRPAARPHPGCRRAGSRRARRELIERHGCARSAPPERFPVRLRSPPPPCRRAGPCATLSLEHVRDSDAGEVPRGRKPSWRAQRKGREPRTRLRGDG